MSLLSRVVPSIEGRGIWEHYTMQDGLPDMKIECLFEDRRGALWIGTHDRGVVQYLDEEFRHFSRREGLPGNGVFSILEDGQGDLWLGTDQGIARYDGESFHPVESGDSFSFLWGSCMDREGRIWFGVEGCPGRPPAVCRWDGERMETIYLADAGEEGGRSIHRIAVDPRGGLWFGGHGLYHYDGEQVHCIEEYPDSFGQIACFHVCRGGDLWFCADSGLYRYRQGAFEPLCKNSVVAIAEDGNGGLWITSHNGCLIHYDKIRSFRIVERRSAVFWSGLCVDRGGRVWIGSYGMGLYCYDPTQVRIFRTGQGIPSDSVRCLAKDLEGDLWVGTWEGLVRYDGSFFRPVERDGGQRIRGASLLADREGRIWIGARNGWLLCHDRGKVEARCTAAAMRGYAIDSLAEDAEGGIWFCSRNGKRLGCCRGEEVVFFSPEEGWSHPMWIGDLEADREGNVWLGSSAPLSWDGLCRYDGEAFRKEMGLGGAPIRVLHEDRRGRLWIGTNEGLFCWEGGRMRAFTEEDGLSCEIITDIAEDRDGILWIGTEGGGVCCYDGALFQIVRFSEDPGYNVIRAILPDGRDRIWLGTESGLILYMPRRSMPCVQIESVVADETHAGKTRVRLSAGVAQLGFHFRGRGVGGESSLVYRYRLRGRAEQWRCTRERQVNYHQIGPGNYTFEVQAVDRDLNYSEPVLVEVSVAEDPWGVLLSVDLDLVKEDLSGKRGELLIVDADPVFVRVCTRLLEQMGHRVHVMPSIEGAIRVQEERNYDLVLLDLASGQMDWKETFRAIRRKEDGPEMVVLAGYADLEKAQEAVHWGAFGYLVKPFEARQILTLIDRVVVFRKDALVSYIRRHAGEIQSRAEIADLFGMSPGTVSNRIKRLTNMSFRNFLRHCRIEKARRLLICTELNVQQIAVRAGFETHEGFTRTFRQLTGWSPLQYRREHRLPF